MKKNDILQIILVSITAITVGVFLQNRIKDFEKNVSFDAIVVRSIKLSNKVIVSYPKEGSIIFSPVLIKGSAPGTWFFEGNIVVKIEDEFGNVLGIGPGIAEDEWMTEKTVHFETKIPFSIKGTQRAFIVIQEDDPSGIGVPRSVSIPVVVSNETSKVPCLDGSCGDYVCSFSGDSKVCVKPN